MDSLRILCDQYLSTIGPRISDGTKKTIRYRVSAWIREFGNLPVTIERIETFRDIKKKAGISPRTTESVITVVRQILEHNGDSIPLGRKLRIPKPNPDVPRVDNVGAIYSKVSAAKWPHKLASPKRCDWWRSFIAISCWTGFRLGDLTLLGNENIEKTSIRLNAGKTERFGRPDICVPITHSMRRHIGMVDQLYPETLFGLTKCYKQLRRELARIADAANVKYVTPQGFRRFAVNAWTSADSLAGKLIQGQSLGSMDHYLDIERHLAKCSADVVMPEEFFTASERKKSNKEEEDLIRFFRRAKSSDRQLIVDLSRRMA